jgi:CDP-diacylglycerol--serine O-phosphatidyltransferase
MFSRNALPNAITLLNLFTGSVAVAVALDGALHAAALLMLACALLDFLDGFAARALNAYSPLGGQLDSLADLVSFGLLPGAIVLAYLKQSVPFITESETVLFLLPFLGFSLTVFSALRLARFNLDETQRDAFIGLPTPANGLFFASWPLVLAYGPEGGMVTRFASGLTGSAWAMLVLTGLFSWLLVSPLSMFSLKFKTFGWKGNRLRISFLAGSLVLLMVFGWQAAPLIMLFYLILSLLFHWSHIRPGESQPAGSKNTQT